MKNKVSIYDIAAYCNVSAATVSYVINGKKKVSEETKLKVLQAIDVLGYYPNYIARALSTGKTNLIGILLPLQDASIAFLQNPFYVEFIGGFEAMLTKYDYDVVIGIEQEGEKLVDWVKRRTVDGLILIGNHKVTTYEILKDLNLPTVLIDDYSEYSKDFNNVRSNDEEGMYQATKYLIDLGHENIGFVGNSDLYLIDKIRYNGYARAMQESNLSIKDDYLFKCDATFDYGLKIVDDILKVKGITAVVCSADILAIAIIKRCEELGKKIPDDLSVVGFDDIQSSAYIYPGLTTIHQEIAEKGACAARILFDIFEHEALSDKLIILEPYLIKRESVKER